MELKQRESEEGKEVGKKASLGRVVRTRGFKDMGKLKEENKLQQFSLIRKWP